MHVSAKPAVLLAAVVVAFGLPVAGPPPAGPAPAEVPPGSWAALRALGSLELGDFGVDGPTGIAWSDRLGALVVPDTRDSRTRLTALTPDEYPVGRVRLPGDVTAGQVVVDPASGAATVLADRGAVSVGAATIRTGSGAVTPRTGPAFRGEDSDGVAYDAAGELVVLSDGVLVRTHPDGREARNPVPADGHVLRGLARHPGTGELFTLDLTARRLLALDDDGAVVASHDASDIAVTDVRGLTFGPSADTTDDPSVQSLYIADAGEPGAPGSVVETRLEPVGLAAHVVMTSSQVRTVQTSSYDPPSPDPSGIAYLPGADRLFVVDGEVDELGIFEGANFFATNRAGAVQALGVSQPWSNEPVGVGYNPENNHLFVSDDDQREVFEVVAGADGRFGSSDDTVTHFDTAGFGNTDPEGVDYDPVSDSIWFADGTNAEVFRVRAGGDGRFGTSDDVETQFDIGRYGARDPEGLGYDSARDTIVVVDDSSDMIYELDKTGALLNTIDTSAANMYAAAGIAVGPSTSGTGRSYYVVARGLDNDNNPTENDGRLYEFSVSLDPLGTPNQPPVVNAGADQSVVLPSSATLSGTVTDDGLPEPPGTVTSTWQQVSGPAPVSFADASSPSTTASFPTHGSYVLRLTATDGSATVSDDVTVMVAPVGGANITEVRVRAGADDAEQALSGFVGLSSSDLELTTDGSTQQVVGLRFAGLQVPRGATITNAYVQFRTDEVSTGTASLTVRAEAADNAQAYTSSSGNVTSRTTSTTSVSWSPPSWNATGETGAAQRTPDVSGLVQAVVDRTGWAQGNALALQVSGTGRRTAVAFEGGASFAPLLHVEYTTGGGGGTPNQPPVVDAGADLTVTLPAGAALQGTVTDDGQPDPPASVTTTWSKVSGPGTVTFSPSAGTEDPTASFSEAGTYVLRLTGYDGELSGADDVTVTVTPEGGSPTALGVIDGVEIESHDHVAPVMDGNGNLYRVTEDTLANGNRPRMMKSVDGGRSWVEQDVANRPTTGDTEGGWMLQDGPTIWFAWQKSSTVHLTRFRTSDHPTGPDSYELGTEQVAAPSAPGPQYASLAKNADGSLWVAYGASPSGGPRSAVVKRLPGGGYGTPIVIDESTSTTAPRLVKGAGDLTHVFYQDHTNHRVYWRTLSTAGVLSAPVRVDTGGTHVTETAITNAVAFTDAGVQVLVVAFADPAGLLRSVEIRDGVVGPERVVSASPVTINPGATTNLAAVAHLAVAGSTVLAMWSDAAHGHVYRDQYAPGGGWGADVLTVDTGPGTTSAAWYVYPAVLSRSGDQARVGFTYDLGPHPDDDSTITYGEITVAAGGGGGGGDPANTAPTVDAGPDRTVTLPASVTLDATVTDDGLPAGGTLRTTWTATSGPGTVTFTPADTPDTTAAFSQPGTYQLQLTADDGDLTGTDQVTVTVEPEPTGGTTGSADVRISAGSDDAEQRATSTGSTLLNSSDLELTTDGKTVQVVGLRFAGLAVPQGATITRAHVQFRTHQVSTDLANLTLRAEAADNAPTYQSLRGDITARATTPAAVTWSPPAWSTTAEAGAAQRTPDLSPLVQAVVSRTGWAAGNALALQVSGTGRRTATAFEGGAAFAPLLHVEYRTGGGGGGDPVNTAPLVDAGPDRAVTLPGSASLNATVSDDGLPSPAHLSYTWSEVSGPGDVTFTPADTEDTTAGFSAAGTYVLRLSVHDGELAGADEVTVTVSSAGGGGTQVAEVRVASGTDDAEQALSGAMEVASSDLELTTDGSTQQVVGLRFAGLQVPQGATVTRAWVQFVTDEVSTGVASLSVRAEATDHALTYQRLAGDVTSRPLTAESVSWSPPAWNTLGEAAAGQRTPDLAAVVQAVVSRAGWTAGNALAVQVSGTGRRTAVSHETAADSAPLLHVEYTTG